MKLTSAQKRALFFVGAYSSTKRYGTWGRHQGVAVSHLRWERRTGRSIQGGPLVEFGKDCAYVLTARGQATFDGLFTKCPTHGWAAPTFPREDPVLRKEVLVCEHCLALCKAVHGYTPTV
jgi:hypothetical protein